MVSAKVFSGLLEKTSASSLTIPPLPVDPTPNTATPTPNLDCITYPITPAEVKAALQKPKSGKAPGICGITGEMLKSGGDNIIL